MANILLVQNDHCQSHWRKLLIAQGHQVEWADNAVSMLEMIHQHRPELLIHTPAHSNLDSLSLLQQVKSQASVTGPFCLIVVSDEGFQKQFQAIKDFADDWIIEPESDLERLWRIQSSLRTYRLTQALQKESDQRQRLAQQLIQNQKMISLGQMISGVAHEINNPVSVVKGNVSHVAEYVQDLVDLIELYGETYPEPTAPIQEQIEEIDLEFLKADLPQVIDSMKTGSERIRQLVQSLKNFYQLDDTESKFVNIENCLEDILLILQGNLKGKKGCQIQVIREYGQLPEIKGYPGQLNQALMNILKNAVDALEIRRIEETSSAPTIWIKTTLTSIAPNPSTVEISIRDNGVGVPLEIQDQIFEPFFTTKSMGRGVGIGLGISYQTIVKQHSGHLTCNSQLGTGTEFIITLPLDSEG
ncbi:MAG: hybrid sensor histidine kinase/response regulator [Oscillatoriales cyanobacterium RM1_1_9]|nr:hybrid sensor histidine kinase/response regulator [Oscillatoriales cyanobacterium SM2_3_0]NJO45592.1 hybrid sensor histidine kinase/response regulator [Oscillatoriales cyanobacterium RM2_1_1]NJO71833.1 hybrid sensor histidine kinase/response regulator [Oscillatoriales cyanobacterium RM1_1_9]